MMERASAALTCGLSLAMVAGVWRDPAAAWPFWLAVAIVVVQLVRLVLWPGGYRPSGSNRMPRRN